MSSTQVHGQFIATAFAQLFVWDVNDGGFVKEDDVQAATFYGYPALPSGDPLSVNYLVVCTDVEPYMQLFAHLISQEMRATWVDNPDSWSMTWYHRRDDASPDDRGRRWRLAFSTKGELDAFRAHYEECVPPPPSSSPHSWFASKDFEDNGDMATTAHTVASVSFFPQASRFVGLSSLALY